MSLEAYDLATYARNNGKWMAAVMRSIRLDAEHNEGRNVETLANLGQYLAEDLSGYMDAEAERINKAEGMQ